nr:MAG TPA: IrrE protein [Caudoviricetes sp.]
MTDLMGLYRIAYSGNIDVDCFELNKREAISIVAIDGTCAIAIDPFKLTSEQDEKMKLAHELGHCKTGSFYNQWATCDIREKHEYKADKWAAHYLIPPDKLQEAAKEGCTEPWELAERLDVTEDFIRKTIYIYQCEGLIE